MLDTDINKIGICGGLRSGKDSVGKLLVNKYGFRRFAFGDSIYELCLEYFPERMEAGKDRPLLQGVGQDLRKYDPDIWVRKTFNKIKQALDFAAFSAAINADEEWPNIVVTDLRQPNEYEALRAAGYTIIRVNASLEARQRRAEAAGDVFSPEDMQHDTESHYASFDVDYELQNDGDLDQLAEQVDYMISCMRLAAAGDPGGAARGIR